MSTQQSDALAAALALLEGGFSVVPVHHGSKRPSTPWRTYTRRRMTEDEARAAFVGDVGLAVVCGKVSGGLLVVDVDVEAGDWPEDPDLALTLAGAPQVRTPSGGRHLWFRAPDGETAPTTAGVVHRGVDTRGEGGIAVCPPTRAADGVAYEWVTPPPKTTEDLPEPPEWLWRALAARRTASDEGRPKVDELMPGVEEGRRNDSAARVAGHYLALGLSEEETLTLLRTWNRRCRPPLDDDELRRVVASIARRERLRRGDETRPENVDLQEVVEVVHETFGVELEDVFVVPGDTPLIGFRVAGTTAMMPLGQMTSWASWARTVTSAARVVPRRLPPRANPGWDYYANLMMAVARTVGDAEQATTTGNLAAWLRDYVEEHPPVEQGEVAMKAQPILLGDGQVAVHKDTFRRWLRERYGVLLSHQALTQYAMITPGVEVATVGVKTTEGTWTTWRVLRVAFS